MDKACRESFAITLTFPFLLEENLSETQQQLQRLTEWCERKNKTVELVVNDWGTAHLAAHFPVFSICLGILLNKRKKDPRMAYKLGDRTLFEKNSVHAAFYRKYLKAEFQIERYEWESCGNTGYREVPGRKKQYASSLLSDQYLAVLSTVRSSAPKEAAARRCRCGNARGFAKNRRFYIRSICG